MNVNFDRFVYRYLLALAVATLATGTVFYHLVEKLSWLDSYYLSVVTLATVGYGDITPKTSAGKLFTTFYILIAVGIITTFISYSLKRRATKIESRRKKDRPN